MRCDVLFPSAWWLRFWPGAASERALASFVPAFTMSNTTGSAHIDGQFTLGYTFETTSPFAIDRLGVFAQNGFELMSSHPVAIWDSAGNIVAQTTVDGNDGETLTNQFLYQTLDSPVTLPPGMYTIGALYSVESGANDDPLVFMRHGPRLRRGDHDRKSYERFRRHIDDAKHRGKRRPGLLRAQLHHLDGARAVKYMDGLRGARCSHNLQHRLASKTSEAVQGGAAKLD